MTLLSLASRMVGRRRRIMLRAAIPLGVASFVLVVVIAVVAAAGAGVREAERTQLRGELAAVAGPGLPPGGEDSVLSVSPGESLLRTDVSDDSRELLISDARVVPAVVRAGTTTLLVSGWYTDVDRELEFRGVSRAEAPPGSDELVLITDRRRAEPDLDPGAEVVLYTPGLEPVQGVVGWIVTGEQAEPHLLIPVDLYSQSGSTVERGGSPSTRDAGLARLPGYRIARVRGVDPLPPDQVAQIRGTSLSPTGWRQSARERMRPLWLLAVGVAFLLYAAGGFAVAPSVAILVGRYRREFRLLLAIGYRRRYVRRLIAAIGALTGGTTATVGAVAGLVVIAVMRGRGLASTVLPLFWLSEQPVPSILTPRPSLPMVAAAILAAALVGACAALPAVRHAGSMSGGKDSSLT